MRDFGLLILVIPMVLASLRFVHTSAMFWIWSALAGPTAFVFGFLQSIPINKIAVGVTVISLAVDRTKRRFFMDSTLVFQILFVMQGVLSVSFGVTELPRTYDLLDRMVKILILAVILRVANRNRLELHSLMIAVALSMGVHGVLEGAKFVVTLGSHTVIPSPTLGDNNHFALFVLMVVPLFNYLAKNMSNRLTQLAFAGLGVGVFLGVMAAKSRGAMIGAAAVGLAMAAASKRKGLSLLVLIGLGVGIVVFAPSKWVERMDTIAAAEADDSFMSRVSSWKMNTILAINRPLLGGGYSAMEDPKVFRDYLPQFGMLDFVPTNTPRGALAAHSIYFQVLGDTGFLGLSLFLAMIASGFYNVRRIRMLTRHDPSLAWANEMATALQISLIGFLISGAALSAAYSELLYIELALISMLRRSLFEATGSGKAVPAWIAERAAAEGRALVVRNRPAAQTRPWEKV